MYTYTLHLCPICDRSIGSPPPRSCLIGPSTCPSHATSTTTRRRSSGWWPLRTSISTNRYKSALRSAFVVLVVCYKGPLPPKRTDHNRSA